MQHCPPLDHASVGLQEEKPVMHTYVSLLLPSFDCTTNSNFEIISCTIEKRIHLNRHLVGPPFMC